MNFFKNAAMVVALLGTLATPTVRADEQLQAALNGAQRTEANRSRDGWRHPAATLAFFGIAPGMTVVELNPGSGWYTEILAPYLKAQGQLTVGLVDPASEDEADRKNFARFQKKLTDNPAVFSQVKTAVFEPPKKLKFAPDNSVDMVLTFRNVHNWVGFGDEQMTLLFKSVYHSLKPGGIFGVVDHRLPADQIQDASASSGYVSEAYVIRLAESAGFRLAGRSEINANPKDHADHKKGVWALPPTFANKDEDRQQYAEIGESDRMTLKFVKN